MKRLAITRITLKQKTHIVYCMLDEYRNLVDFQIFEPPQESIINQVYIGRVDKVAPNIQAAFVRISPDVTAYLSLNDVKCPLYTNKRSKKPQLCAGDELLVQVTKEAVKTKGPVVSTRLTLHGKYCVLTTDSTTFGISKKIAPDRAKELRALLHSVCPEETNADPAASETLQKQEQRYGILLRTNAAEIADACICDDIRQTIVRYRKLVEESIHLEPYTLVFSNPQGYIERLKTLRFAKDLAEIDGIYTDQPDLYEELKEELYGSSKYEKLRFYQDEMVALPTLYHLNGQIEKLLSKKIWLKSGANIIIEQLETLTVIDINTGKNQSSKEDILFAVNKEAAIEIARQLRLRNISGMIVIDFINMKSDRQKQELIRLLKAQIKNDTVPCSFIDITKLGLVELTRKKVQKSLKEIVG